MNRAERRRQRKKTGKAAKNAKSVRSATPSPGQQVLTIGQQTLTIGQALDLAVQHHTAGRLPEAENIYQQVLQADPGQPVALHLLGVTAFQVGKHGIAVDLITKALAVKPDFAEAHNNLGNAFKELGRLDEAAASYRQALVLKPDFADARYNLGNVFKELGRPEEAAASYRQALALKPGYAEAHNNLGAVLQDQGKLDGAVASYRQALAVTPGYAEAHNNLGTALHDLGKLDGAVASYRQALILKPGYAEAHNNLGNAFKVLGRLEEAVANYRRALAIRPGYAEAQCNLGTALQEMGKLDGAAASYHQALAAKPDYAEAHNKLGSVFQALGKLDGAVASYRQAIVLKPDFADAYNNLGIALHGQGKLAEAIAAYHESLRLRPGFDATAAGLLPLLRHACAWPDAGALEPIVDEFTKRSMRDGAAAALTPFNHITSSDDAAGNYTVARAKSRAIAKSMSGLKTDFQFSARRSPDSKITIGYLSNDFRNHATAHLMLSLFGLHDRKDFNIFTFSHGQIDESGYREKIKNDSDRFFDLQTAPHLDSAKQIFESGVDILVDLKGHTGGNRLEICALRPAPVQAAYLGFPGTSGADFLDYIITDRIVTPEDQAPYYAEQFVYLPHCYQINDHRQKIADASFARSDSGLPEKGFIFCSFNSNYKIEPVMFGVWMNLLKKAPDSVLWLFKGHELAARNLKSEAEARGVDGDRLVFAEWMPKDQHLARYRLADLALDTRICGGHTTTSDALWAGVPVVAMLGAHFASRVSASLLSAVGLTECITDNLKEYEALALRLSRNPDAFDDVKTKLARNRLRAPLFDTPRFAGNLENAYRRMWENYLSGAPPSRIDVIEG